MKKSIKNINIIMLFFLIELNAYPQYFVKVKSDSVRFVQDSVVLSIETGPGDIAWEVSKDSLTWTSLDQNNDSLFIRIDSSAYYRAVLTDGTCYPVNSAVALVAFRSINVQGNTVIIDSIGGIYTLISGIKLIVPPGAVDENVTVSMELLDEGNADLKLPFDSDPGKVYSTGIYNEPSGILFSKPVRIRLPALNYQSADIPFVYLYNSLFDSWIQNTGTLTCSEREQYIEFSTKKLLPVRIELCKDVFAFGKSSGKSKAGEIDCHELLVEIENTVYDIVGKRASGECFAIKDDLSVTFTQCTGDNVATANFREIGDKCSPKITHEITKSCLAVGESAIMTFKVTIGPGGDNDLPLENQTIVISVPDGMTVSDPEPKTDIAGVATVTVTRVAEVGVGNIDYILLAEYYLSEITATSEGVTEHVKSFPKSFQAKGSQEMLAAPCGSQVTTVLLSANENTKQLKKGDSRTLSCKCFDQNSNEIDCGTVVYSIVPGSAYPTGGAIAVDPSVGMVACLGPGVATVQAVASGVPSRNDIFFSVAYQGSIVMNGVTDHNISKGCGCEEDGNIPPYIWKWYVVTWSVDLNFYLWLSELNNIPYGYVEGVNRYEYTIDYDSRCKNATFVEQIEGLNFSPSGYPFSDGTTRDVISGADFALDYCWWDFRGFGNLQNIVLSCNMNSSGGISVHVSYFWPHGCVLALYPPDFNLQ
jgi:hypothetical protein